MRTAAPALSVLLLTACHRPQPPAGPPTMPPTPVTVAVVTATDIPLPLEYLGRTEGSREIEIRARVNGFLDSRHFQEGAMVAAGDLLFRIDRKPLLAQKATAEADVAAAEARQIQALREQQRLQPLVAEEAVSRKQVDDAVSAELVAAADLAAARARLQQVEVDLGYTEVKAPIAGKIGRALRQEGSLVDAGAGGLLTTLLQLDPIHVAFQRSENQQAAFDRDVKSGRLVVPDGGLSVEIRYRDGTVLGTGGAIDFVDGRLDTATGTIPMRATLPNADLRLRAGQAVKVVLHGAILRAALTVPQRAVVESPQGKVVLLAVDTAGTNGAAGTTVLEPRPIEVGEWVTLPGDGPTARSWVIKSGLAAGDRVILDHLVVLSRMPKGAPLQVVAPEGK